MKVSSTPAKRSIPGRLRVRRLRDAGGAWLADAIYDDELDLDLADPLVHPESMVELPVADDAESEELLVPAMEAGARVGEPTPLAEARRRAIAAVDAMPAALRARSTDDRHFIGIDGRLSALREKTTLELSR